MYRLDTLRKRFRRIKSWTQKYVMTPKKYNICWPFPLLPIPKVLLCVKVKHGCNGKKSCDILTIRKTALQRPSYALDSTESCFHHPVFDLRGTRKVEIRQSNVHFDSKRSYLEKSKS